MTGNQKNWLLFTTGALVCAALFAAGALFMKLLG